MKRSNVEVRSAEPLSYFNFKRSKLDPAKEQDGIGNGREFTHNLLDLSDDVLLNIFEYLSPFDVLALHSCCSRLSRLCCDRTLWNKLDLRGKYLPLDDLKRYVKFMQQSTTLVAIQGDKNSDMEYSEVNFLNSQFLKLVTKKCSQLKELIIKNYYILEEKTQIKDFPSTLESLSLEGCEICRYTRSKSYLFQIDIYMPNLTCLILSNCEWFEPHSLMVISKIPKLKELRLNSCHGLGECFAYTSIATRFGLRTLEVADFRDTFLGDTELCCFSSTSTLKELYLECPNPEVERQPENELQNQDVFHIQLQLEVHRDGNRREAENNANRSLVTDRTICTLGSYKRNQKIIQNTRNGLQIIEGEKPSWNNPNLKKLIVSPQNRARNGPRSEINYTGVTNQSLDHLATNVLKLEYVDVTGTAVTDEGVQNFKNQRPNVKLVSSFDRNH